MRGISGSVATGRKIRSLLAPKEYTRLDGMIDVMFTTAKDVESATDPEIGVDEEALDATSTSTKIKGVWQLTEAALLQSKRDEIIAALGNREGMCGPFSRSLRSVRHWQICLRAWQ